MQGQKINDHGSWAGKSSNESVCPVGNKVKTFTSSEGVGKLSYYCDSEAAIKKSQDLNAQKARAHPAKEYHRN